MTEQTSEAIKDKIEHATRSRYRVFCDYDDFVNTVQPSVIMYFTENRNWNNSHLSASGNLSHCNSVLITTTLPGVTYRLTGRKTPTYLLTWREVAMFRSLTMSQPCRRFKRRLRTGSPLPSSRLVGSYIQSEQC